jgi:hypothetical protein
MQAMLKMVRIDIGELQRAYDQSDSPDSKGGSP